MVYFLIIMPMNSMAAKDTGAREYLFFLLFTMTKGLPILIMWWSNLSNKISIPKAMYLSPMQEEDRRKYINAMMAIKIGFPVMISVILQLSWSATNGRMRWMELLTCVFAHFSFGIGMYVCSELHSKFDRYIRFAVRGKDGTGKDAWLNWFCMVVAIALLFGFSAVESAEPMTTFDWIFFIGGVVALVILDIAILVTRYQSTVEDICNYEVAFNVLGKVKK